MLTGAVCLCHGFQISKNSLVLFMNFINHLRMIVIGFSAYYSYSKIAKPLSLIQPFTSQYPPLEQLRLRWCNPRLFYPSVQTIRVEDGVEMGVQSPQSGRNLLHSGNFLERTIGNSDNLSDCYPECLSHSSRIITAHLNLRSF